MSNGKKRRVKRAGSRIYDADENDLFGDKCSKEAIKSLKNELREECMKKIEKDKMKYEKQIREQLLRQMSLKQMKQERRIKQQCKETIAMKKRQWNGEMNKLKNKIKQKHNIKINKLKGKIKELTEIHKKDQDQLKEKEYTIKDLEEIVETLKISRRLFEKLVNKHIFYTNGHFEEYEMTRRDFDSFVTRLEAMEVDYEEIGASGLPEKQIREMREKVEQLENELRRLQQEELLLKRQINMKKKLQSTLTSEATKPISNKKDRADKIKRNRSVARKARLKRFGNKLTFEPAGAGKDEKEKNPKGCEALLYMNEQYNREHEKKETLKQTGERYSFKKQNIEACEKAAKLGKECDRTASEKIEEIKKILNRLKF